MIGRDAFSRLPLRSIVEALLQVFLWVGVVSAGILGFAML